MKKIFFICFLISIICSGCSSSRLTKSEYDTFNDYVNIVGEKCMIYIENRRKNYVTINNKYTCNSSFYSAWYNVYKINSYNVRWKKYL